MTTMLGKRKRKAPEPKRAEREASADSSGPDVEDAQAIFKRFFEAQFKPLPEVKRKAVKVVEEVEKDDDDDDEDDWEGISEEEDGSNIEVVEHGAEQPTELMSKAELKRFMSSKPPIESTLPSSLGKSKTALPSGDDASESANLKKDLALQRLLAESHLLDSSSSPTLSGSNRHKATDMRLQTLGAKTSILTQQRMPQIMRKGIVAKKMEKEEVRRKEARENGIILEKAGAKGKLNGKDGRRDTGKRDRGIGAPGVGRFKGGTLTLSKKDIFEIEGPKRGGSGRGGRGGKGGRGGRGGAGGRGKKF